MALWGCTQSHNDNTSGRGTTHNAHGQSTQCFPFLSPLYQKRYKNMASNATTSDAGTAHNARRQSIQFFSFPSTFHTKRTQTWQTMTPLHMQASFIPFSPGPARCIIHRQGGQYLLSVITVFHPYSQRNGTRQRIQ